MFDYQVSKHPHFDEACRAFALRHNLVQLAERAGMNVQIKQSPAMHYGHGWITGEDGKRWHPCHSQDELLSELTTRKRRKSKCMRQKVKWFISFVTEGRVIQYLKMICSVAIRHCRAMAVTFSR